MLRQRLPRMKVLLARRDPIHRDFVLRGSQIKTAAADGAPQIIL